MTRAKRKKDWTVEDLSPVNDDAPRTLVVHYVVVQNDSARSELRETVEEAINQIRQYGAMCCTGSQWYANDFDEVSDAFYRDELTDPLLY